MQEMKQKLMNIVTKRKVNIVDKKKSELEDIAIATIQNETKKRLI